MTAQFLSAFPMMTPDDVQTLTRLGCLRTQSFSKGERVLYAGDQAEELGLVLSGCVHIEMNDVWGNKSILARAAQGEVFAETYAICREVLLVDVTAAEKCSILFLRMSVALDEQFRQEKWQHRLIQNLMQLASRKNLLLSTRIFCTTPKTIRDRLVAYLTTQAALQGKETFSVPFNRQQMAEYLNVDRSALSKELGKMREEGLIAFRKDRFQLLTDQLMQP